MVRVASHNDPHSRHHTLTVLFQNGLLILSDDKIIMVKAAVILVLLSLSGSRDFFFPLFSCNTLTMPSHNVYTYYF